MTARPETPVRLSSEREAEIAARHEAATKGPWEANTRTGVVTNEAGDPLAVFGGGAQDRADAEFTAHAREDVPTLIAELAAVRAERDQAQIRAAELDEQQERRRAHLVALRNDALNMRGALSPAGEKRKVPFPLGQTLLPAVEWLIARITEQTRYIAHLEAEICQCQPELESGEYMHEATCPVAEIQMRMLGCPGFEGNPVAPGLCAGCHEPREDHEEPVR